jgi:ELWxxDGT repeat protein
MGDIVTFHARTDAEGVELWRTDGTESGTKLVKDIYEGENDSWPEYMKVIDGKLYFAARDDEHGVELWVSDGTADGTKMIADIREGTDGSYPQKFTKYNGEIYFSADGNDTIRRELYKTDGTQNGTTLVKDIRSGDSGSYPKLFNVMNGVLYFKASDDNGTTVWKTDGTEAGTVKVFGEEYDNIYPQPMTTVNNKLIFTAYNELSGDDVLYSYDGTAAEPTILTTDENATDPGNFKVVDDMLWFMVETDDQTEYGDNLSALWKTDGSVDGTTVIKDQLCPQGSMDGDTTDTEDAR